MGHNTGVSLLKGVSVRKTVTIYKKKKRFPFSFFLQSIICGYNGKGYQWKLQSVLPCCVPQMSSILWGGASIPDFCVHLCFQKASRTEQSLQHNFLSIDPPFINFVKKLTFFYFYMHASRKPLRAYLNGKVDRRRGLAPPGHISQ